MFAIGADAFGIGGFPPAVAWSLGPSTSSVDLLVTAFSIAYPIGGLDLAVGAADAWCSRIRACDGGCSRCSRRMGSGLLSAPPRSSGADPEGPRIIDMERVSEVSPNDPCGCVAIGRAVHHGGAGTRRRTRKERCSRCGRLSARG